MMFEINSRRPVRKRIPSKPSTTNDSQNSGVKVYHSYIYNSVAHILWEVKGYA
ncbi:MAG: hypothetical protein H7141_07445 [Burkholderiales bacterium]|nr:hypothetical protein [Bacteroidia bacterium]